MVLYVRYVTPFPALKNYILLILRESNKLLLEDSHDSCYSLALGPSVLPFSLKLFLVIPKFK